MLIISPRSYVTAAFDLLFPELAEEIEEWLKRLRPDDWWQYYIYDQRESIFGASELEERERRSGKPFPKNGCLEELIEQFDEYYLNALVNRPSLKPERENSHDRKMAKLVWGLADYRNDWAHRGKRASSENGIMLDEKEWAEKAICKIRDFADFIDKPFTVKRVSILLFKMKCDWIDDTTVLPSHTELLDWLYTNVVGRVIAHDSPIDKETKRRAEKAFENLRKYVGEASEDTASRYVIDYYWNAIRGKTDVYHAILLQGKKENIPTFEDVVERFTEFCYGEKTKPVAHK